MFSCDGLRQLCSHWEAEVQQGGTTCGTACNQNRCSLAVFGARRKWSPLEAHSTLKDQGQDEELSCRWESISLTSGLDPAAVLYPPLLRHTDVRVMIQSIVRDDAV